MEIQKIKVLQNISKGLTKKSSTICQVAVSSSVCSCSKSCVSRKKVPWKQKSQNKVLKDKMVRKRYHKRKLSRIRAEQSESVRCQLVAVSAAAFGTGAAIQDLVVFYDSYDAQNHSWCRWWWLGGEWKRCQQDVTWRATPHETKAYSETEHQHWVIIALFHFAEIKRLKHNTKIESILKLD